MKIGFIGVGNVASKLAQCLSNSGLAVAAVSSLTKSNADQLSNTLPDCVSVTSQEVIDLCDLIFITTPEHAVASVVDTLTWDSSKSVVHCSGIVPISVFDKARESGSAVGIFYPMHNFNSSMDIAGATIAIEAEQPFFKVLENIATVIGCRVISKPECILFHAAVPYSQEFLVAVLNQGVKLWSNLGISEEQATPALLHLMKSIIQEIETDGMQRTGTIVFNDPDTVGEHVDAIKQVDESAADLYKQLTLRTMPFEHHQFKPDDELRMRVWLKSGKLLGK